MSEAPLDSRARLDVRVDSLGREGLTGTAPAELYARRAERERSRSRRTSGRRMRNRSTGRRTVTSSAGTS
jgi:hypothetical protein